MKEALFWNREGEKDAVRCRLCAQNCLVKAGKRGICGVRENREGVLYSLNYGVIVAANVDPIEKKPLYHFLPGSRSFSIASAGCNFRCTHCQNADISQTPRSTGEVPGRIATSDEILKSAAESGSASIAYTYTEPTIFFEFALETARKAAGAGLKNVFVSNGYTGPEAAREIAPVLHGNNIDLKSFSDDHYKRICGARLQPVLDTITLMKELGVWVEVTTLIIPGHNDSDQELREIARFIKTVDPDMPWHVSRFFPTYKLLDAPPTPAGTVKRAREIGLEEGLRYVYTGNCTEDDEGGCTQCPGCGEIVIDRRGYWVAKNLVRGGKCSACGHAIAGVWE